MGEGQFYRGDARANSEAQVGVDVAKTAHGWTVQKHRDFHSVNSQRTPKNWSWLLGFVKRCLVGGKPGGQVGLDREGLFVCYAGRAGLCHRS